MRYASVQETYKTHPSHFPMLLPEIVSTNHAPLTPLQRSVPMSHIRLSRNNLISSASCWDSCAMDVMLSVPRGRCAIKIDGEVNVNRSVYLSTPCPSQPVYSVSVTHNRVRTGYLSVFSPPRQPASVLSP